MFVVLVMVSFVGVFQSVVHFALYIVREENRETIESTALSPGFSSPTPSLSLSISFYLQPYSQSCCGEFHSTKRPPYTNTPGSGSRPCPYVIATTTTRHHHQASFYLCGVRASVAVCTLSTNNLRRNRLERDHHHSCFLCPYYFPFRYDCVPILMVM